MYTIHTTQIHTNRYNEHLLNKPPPTSMKKDIYKQFNREGSREGENKNHLLQESSLDYKRARHMRRQSVVMLSVLCEVAVADVKV